MKEIKTRHNLLEARKKALEQVTHGSIRPHGKLWGMDVFSWMNPDVEALALTIHAFPFPILWLSPSGLLMAVAECDAAIATNIHTVITYDQSSAAEKSGEILHLITTNDIHQAFQKMNALQFKPGIILFCSEGADSEMYQKAFSNYLELHQI
ncbi:hypothetical protein H9Y05_14460 [Crocinitomicaceae bacterium CZZ-1]|uniref:Uncharacterized protein n=1 Tax=Taishania pollutisoli TaxID=2766479 RepID=A0A8J6U2S9_9FLAO|nr:hypothetical protein [Taishania pollutisoli]MBC9813675.1 hypothetical protein [Taishania pollutisoli]